MKPRHILMLFCSVLVVAFSTEVYAKAQIYLCPAIPSGTSNNNDSCTCSITNWSNKARDVKIELLDADGLPLVDPVIIEELPPDESTNVTTPGPNSTGICTCRVTINTKKARVSITRRRAPGTVQIIGIANCSRKD